MVSVLIITLEMIISVVWLFSVTLHGDIIEITAV